MNTLNIIANIFAILAIISALISLYYGNKARKSFNKALESLNHVSDDTEDKKEIKGEFIWGRPKEKLIYPSYQENDDNIDHTYCNIEQIEFARSLGYNGGHSVSEMLSWFKELDYVSEINENLEIEWTYEHNGAYSHSHKTYKEALGVLISKTLLDIRFDRKYHLYKKA